MAYALFSAVTTIFSPVIFLGISLYFLLKRWCVSCCCPRYAKRISKPLSNDADLAKDSDKLSILRMEELSFSERYMMVSTDRPIHDGHNNLTYVTCLQLQRSLVEKQDKNFLSKTLVDALNRLQTRHPLLQVGIATQGDHNVKREGTYFFVWRQTPPPIQVKIETEGAITEESSSPARSAPELGEDTALLQQSQIVPTYSSDNDIPWQKVARRELNMPIQFNPGPLLRAVLLLPSDTAANHHDAETYICHLILTCHHVISDGLSVANLSKETVLFWGEEMELQKQIVIDIPQVQVGEKSDLAVANEQAASSTSVAPTVHRFASGLAAELPLKSSVDALVMKKKKNSIERYWNFFVYATKFVKVGVNPLKFPVHSIDDKTKKYQDFRHTEFHEDIARNIVAKCRQNGVTVTNLVHALAVQSAAEVLNKYPYFIPCSLTVDMRRHITVDEDKVTTMAGKEDLRCYGTTVQVFLSPSVQKSIWEIAKESKKEIGDALARKEFTSPQMMLMCTPPLLSIKSASAVPILYANIGVLDNFPRGEQSTILQDSRLIGTFINLTGSVPGIFLMTSTNNGKMQLSANYNSTLLHQTHVDQFFGKIRLGLESIAAQETVLQSSS